MNSKAKGKRGELELVKKLREYGFNGRRSQQFCGVGDGAADVMDALPNIHIECKRVEKLNISDAITQAKRDAKDGEMPTVFHRRNNEGWLVTMPIESWIEIYREYFSGFELEKGANEHE